MLTAAYKIIFLCFTTDLLLKKANIIPFLHGLSKLFLTQAIIAFKIPRQLILLLKKTLKVENKIRLQFEITETI